MVTGSVASVIYGEPRLTHDVDLVLELRAEEVSVFVELFPIEEFYCPSKETINAQIAREKEGHFNIIHHATGFKADVYPMGQEELHKWAMANRHQIKIEGSDIWIAPPEYVIIKKLQYYKEGQSDKHLRDIEKMLEFSADVIDKTIISQRVAEYDLLDQWCKVSDKS
ncbi:MAG: hypothetical protein KAJ07_05925 [Planctomycetes bacterium]|nr:hypothetical protein [Planctomycetota bacterium]